MSDILSKEKLEQLNNILIKEYNDYTKEEIAAIQARGKGLSFSHLFTYFEQVQDDETIPKDQFNIMEKNILPIISILCSTQDIVKSLTEMNDYSSIIDFIDMQKKLDLEMDYVVDYNNLIRETIDKKLPYDAFQLYCLSYKDLDPKLKEEAIKFFIQNKSKLYIYDKQIEGFTDIVKTAKNLEMDMTPLFELINSNTKVLINLCIKEEYDLIDEYYKNASDEAKKLVDAIYKLKDFKEITTEIFEKALEDVEGFSYRSDLAQYAVKKGYIPPIKNFEYYLYSDTDTAVRLANVNLAYYLLTRMNFTTFYADEDIYKSLNSDLKKQAFKLFQKYKPQSSWGKSPLILFELEDLLKDEEISKYFDENGCKKEFLFALVDKYTNFDISYSENDFFYLVYDECKKYLNDKEKKYYEFFFISLLSYDNNFNYSTSENLKQIIQNKEEFYKLISSDEEIIQILNSCNQDFNIVLGLLKIGVLNDEIKDKFFSANEIIALNILKEIIDNNSNLKEEFFILNKIYTNRNLFDENGLIKNEFYKYLISENCINSLLSLSNEYISNNQKKFISIVSSIIEKERSVPDGNKMQFIFDAFNNPNQIDKYIIDNKPTKELVDKLFEIGCLYCVEKIDDYESYLTDKQKIIISIYQSIKNKELKDVYSDFIVNSLGSIYSGSIKEEVITKIPGLLESINLSNSSEVAGRYVNIAKLILQNTSENSIDPMLQFKRIEKIFLTKELSHMDKIFKSFQLLYPHSKLIETIINNSDRVSPTLLKYALNPEETILGKEAERIYGDSSYAVEMVMYSDLLKTTIASNDKTFIEYIENIEKGNQIFGDLVNQNKGISSLSAEDKYILSSYIHHLENLYNKSHPGNKIELLDNLEDNLLILVNLYKDVDITLIPDQIIKNKYRAYLGITTLEELKAMMQFSHQAANSKGREYFKRPFVLEKGDLIKGIGDIRYFDTIIQNGSVSKEFLGGDVESDYTPFDTDLSYVLEQKDSFEETIRPLDAKSYGPIYFIIKDATSKFNCTRNELKQSFEFDESVERFRQIELFRTGGATHYGIRTGFASTQIDYICCEDTKYVGELGLVLAKNGFYIPVVDKTGKIIFSPEQYEYLRSKMGGLSYYGMSSYDFSTTIENVFTSSLVEAIAANMMETSKLKRQLEAKLRQGFENVSLVMKTKIDGDMQPGSVELIDTGSTGRGTNQIGDGDFDFTVRLDRIDIMNGERTSLIARQVCQALGIGESSGDLRKAKVDLNGKEVELDISYAAKSDRITYTTDMCLSDRLETIKRQDPNKHLLVLSNIVLAKTLLKKGECYKPHHASDNPQGGLGGVGTENWILQNGGSLETAATEFLIAAGVLKVNIDETGKEEIIIDENNQTDYNLFKTSYSIWDFGQNQLFEKRQKEFPHDNFVWNNMNQNGYKKMVKVMQTYMLELHPEIKFIPEVISPNESDVQKEEREMLNKVVTDVKSILQGLRQENIYSTTESITEEKTK